jgi:hypothetical protein
MPAAREIKAEVSDDFQPEDQLLLLVVRLVKHRVVHRVSPLGQERPTATQKARLIREAQAIARISHPNVIAAYDVGTFGDVGMFSFQEFKQLSTGDGAMLTLKDAELADKMENVWAFSGESPTMMTLNWRMNEMTAAMGLAQLQRVDHIVKDYYNVTLGILNEAIKGCAWLRPRKIPKETVQSGYWFACAWEGDKHGRTGTDRD